MTDLYGKTLRLDGDMDLVFDGANRLLMIQDTDKVEQDLKVLMKVGSGDNLFHLETGLDMVLIVQCDDDKVTMQKINEALRQYRYVKEVKSVFISRVERMETWSVDVILSTEEEIKMTFGGMVA